MVSDRTLQKQQVLHTLQAKEDDDDGERSTQYVTQGHYVALDLTNPETKQPGYLSKKLGLFLSTHLQPFPKVLDSWKLIGKTVNLSQNSTVNFFLCPKFD